MKRKKSKRLPWGSKPCCSKPMEEYHSSWQDETGLCVNCGKRLRFGTKAYWDKQRGDDKR